MSRQDAGVRTFALTRRHFAAGTAALIASPTLLRAQTAYPSRSITIVAGAAPGGPTDVVSRAAAQRLSQRLKQSVVVENRTGASGNLAAQTVAKADADGYTLITLLAPLAQNQATFKAPGFDIQKDFVPIAHLASTDLIIVGRAQLPVSNLKEMIAFLQANPGKLSCGSQSPPQMEYLKRTTKVDFTVVPYKGSALITNDLIAGQIDIGLVPYSDVAQHIQAGSVKPLFTCGPKRVAKLPQMEAVAETFPGFGFWSWYGVAAPARTPEPVVALLRKELGEITRMEDYRAFIDNMGLARVDAPEKFGDVIDAEVALWKKLVQELNLPRV